MSETGRRHGPTGQANLAHVARQLDSGKFSADDARALTAAIDDVHSLQSRIQDALKALARGELSTTQAREVADALRA